MSSQSETTQKFIKDARTIAQKVEGLEQTIPALIRSIGKSLDEFKAKQDFMAEWMDAVVGVVGLEKVQEAVLETRAKRAQAECDAAKADVVAQKAAGNLVNLDKVEDECFVILTEVVNDTNAPVGPGWFKMHMSELKPEFRELLKGKEVGYSERRESTTFTIVEVLKAVPQANVTTEKAVN